MKIRYLFFMFVCFVADVCSAQSFEEVLRAVMVNSTEMKSEVASAEADMAGHRVGISLDGPEVEFGYLWGAPTDIGSRKDISVSQKLDVSTIFGLRKKVADAQDDLAMSSLDVKRLVYLLDASRVLINVTCCNRLLGVYRDRLSDAKTLVDVYTKALANGEVNRIEVGKVQLELADVESEIGNVELERQRLLLELKTMNGGREIDYSAVSYPSSFSFASLMECNSNGVSSISSAYSNRSKQQIQLAQKETAVAKSDRLPGVSVGYMAELTREEKFRGVTVGVSVPLWTSGKAVRHAKAREISVRSQVADDSLKLKVQIEGLHLRVEKLHNIYKGMQKKLDAVSNMALLRKALDAGELSLVEYLTELGLYYELKAKLLYAERDYYSALAELKCVE